MEKQSENSNGATPCRLSAIRRCSASVKSERVEYRLYEMSADGEVMGYAVGVRGFGERRVAFAGRDYALAERIFESVAHHCVTPCTLTDVVEDMMFGAEYFGAT
ncbi:MAG: hypothetical protein E7589_05520 [Ruminococcaceae bacterium]|nr:hypothetical protein [Oscillospiraceae bacterium]